MIYEFTLIDIVIGVSLGIATFLALIAIDKYRGKL